MGENSWAWEVRENLLIHAVLNLCVYDTGMEKLPTAPGKMAISLIITLASKFLQT